MNAFRAKPLRFPMAAFALWRGRSDSAGPWPPFPIPVAHEHSWILSLVGYGLVVLALALDLWAVKTLLDRTQPYFRTVRHLPRYLRPISFHPQPRSISATRWR